MESCNLESNNDYINKCFRLKSSQVQSLVVKNFDIKKKKKKKNTSYIIEKKFVIYTITWSFSWYQNKVKGTNLIKY